MCFAFDLSGQGFSVAGTSSCLDYDETQPLCLIDQIVRSGVPVKTMLVKLLLRILIKLVPFQ